MTSGACEHRQKNPVFGRAAALQQPTVLMGGCSTATKERGACERAAGMPRWHDSMRGPFSFTALTGGATNTLYLARGACGAQVVVRCLAALPASVVDRRMEARLQEMCAAAGLGPAILRDLEALKPPGSPMSWRAEAYVSGRSLDRESMRLPRNLRALGATLRAMHDLSPAESRGESGSTPRISAWSRAAALGDAADALLATDPRSAASSERVALPTPGGVVKGADSWRSVADSVAASVKASLRSLGPEAGRERICHCDANPGNVIVLRPSDAALPSAGPGALGATSAARKPGSAASSSGAGVSSPAAAGPRLQLIDFEYAAWAPRALDLANVLAEAEFENSASAPEGEDSGQGFAHNPRWALPRASVAELLAGYGGSALAPQLAKEARALLPLIHLSWGLWGVMMAARSGQSVNEVGAAVDADGGRSGWSYWHYAAVRLGQAAAAGAARAPVAAAAGSAGDGRRLLGGRRGP